MKKKIIVLLVVLLALIGVGVGYYLTCNSKKEVIKEVATSSKKDEVKTVENEENEDKEEKVQKKQFDIFNGTDRPIAFMIDNNKNAQPQASLNSAYLVYEIIVEGGETRLMALFKGKTCDEVGPIRSARHYFLDYVMENDALYAHLGRSPQAEEQIEKFGINNINGQIYDTGKSRTKSSLYWRVTHKKAPHNAYTNTDSILEIAKQCKYETTSNKDSVLNYVMEEVELTNENAVTCNSIVLPYAQGHKVEYKYDSETKRYIRYSKGSKIFDETTNEAVTTKNIIVTFAKNYTLDDGENKGRQDVITIGELDGYYITNGKAIKIKCKKKSREAQTQYLDLTGKEIEVNDGNTWINIIPIDSKVVISE